MGIRGPYPCFPCAVSQHYHSIQAVPTTRSLPTNSPAPADFWAEALERVSGPIGASGLSHIKRLSPVYTEGSTNPSQRSHCDRASSRSH